MIMNIFISSEELKNNRLKPKYNDNIASFAGYVDKKIGYKTNLISIEYNPVLLGYELIIEKCSNNLTTQH